MRAPIRRIALTLASCGLSLAVPCHAQVRDVELKAAYIYNFALFTSWPDAAAPAAAHTPFTVCASPDSALWPSLQALAGRPVNGRAWTVADIAAGKAQHCDIAVLARAAERPAALAPGVLVVRDGPGHEGPGHDGPGHGAAITLVDDDEHVRFDVDTQEAAKSGLKFSSRLLRLARNVQ
jgi:hypothetical protein